MKKYGDHAMLPDGDVGPDGENLISNWISKEDRIMFVALQGLKCVGCVGVKVGTDIEKQESGSVVASIWRLSVDERARRQGVGMALMCAAEDWARQQGCSSMSLKSANKIAAKFYVEKAGYKEEPFPMDESLFHHYMRLVMNYKKSLVENGDRNQ
jgi:GNAT superfamily N-acetyltransferase